MRQDGRGIFGTVGEQQEDRLMCAASRQRQQKLEAAFVAPVRIFDDDEKWLPLRPLAEEPGQQGKQTSSFLLGVGHARLRMKRRIGKLKRQVWEQAHELTQGIVGRRSRPSNASKEHARELYDQRIRIRMIGLETLSLDQMQAALLRGALDLGGQARFPGARLSTDESDMTRFRRALYPLNQRV